jgi:hypothetical protein
VRFERSANRFSSRDELVAEQFPSYFEPLSLGEVIPASEARTDPRTYEFRSAPWHRSRLSRRFL